ncbi:ATP-binding protein [Kitasatospora cineracea]|uniref:ATP-binding protein n=1 Tax=Kitasatospora cineracea TaxID=88074 RepID=UPI0033D4DC58
MTDSSDAAVPQQSYQPHPYLGGRAVALRALAAWRSGGAGAPRTVLVTGRPGSGRSRLLTGFLMLCEPSRREEFDLSVLDPATVPPGELPAPPVFDATGLSAVQLRWLVTDHFSPGAVRAEELDGRLAGIGSAGEPVTVVVADADRAGVLPRSGEPARVAEEVLRPLALAAGVRLLAEVDRADADRLAEVLPAGELLVIDLDREPWRDEEGLRLQAEFSLRQPDGAAQLARTADSPLVVRLAAWSARSAPDGPVPLPRTVGDALDLQAELHGVTELTLRRLLAPLALAGPGEPLPLELWAPLASAVAGKDLGPALAGGQHLLLPFFDLVTAEGRPPAVRIVHPALGAELRARLGSTVHEVQRRLATALLATLGDGDGGGSGSGSGDDGSGSNGSDGPGRWAAAAPYVREQLAGHALEGGLLPGLLADPGFLLHAEQVRLRAAVEHLVATGAELPPTARTWLRLAPLFTRQEPGPELRAALLEHAARQDGLPAPEFGLQLPWRTLWARPLDGVRAVTAAARPAGGPVLVAYRPGAEPELAAYDALTGEPDGTDPALLVRPTDEERSATPLGLSTGGDYLRLWTREADGRAGAQVALFLSAEPLGGADLTPDGLLLLADARGVAALRPTALASVPPTAPNAPVLGAPADPADSVLDAPASVAPDASGSAAPAAVPAG